jgi:hypothetical protein
MTRRLRRRVIALIVVLACLRTTPANAFVFVVADLLNIAKHEVLNIWADTKDALMQHQLETTWHLVQRLSLFTDLTNYLAPNAPPWLIRGITSAFSDLQASADFERAMQGQRPADVAYSGIARALLPIGDTAVQYGETNPAAANALRADLATLDIGASAIITGTDQTGRIRSTHVHEEDLLQSLETDVFDPSDKESATAAADKLSASILIQARQQEARGQLATALTEQLLVDSKRDRDAEVETMNMRLIFMQAGRAVGQSYIAGSANDLRTWRQP